MEQDRIKENLANAVTWTRANAISWEAADNMLGKLSIESIPLKKTILLVYCAFSSLRK